jgi:hypothetical protein
MVLSAVCCGVAQAKMAPAGLKIENIANAQFIDDSGNQLFCCVSACYYPNFACLCGYFNPRK